MPIKPGVNAGPHTDPYAMSEEDDVNRTWIIAILSAMLSASPAEAGRQTHEGVPVTVKVVDVEGEPIPTATIRHPDEAVHHRVNTITGELADLSVLYLPDGGELVFTPGMPIRLEVSAPGFMPQVVQYDVRKRRNKFEVTLTELVMDDELEIPIIQFDRDNQREFSRTGPVQ